MPRTSRFKAWNEENAVSGWLCLLSAVRSECVVVCCCLNLLYVVCCYLLPAVCCYLFESAICLNLLSSESAICLSAAVVVCCCLPLVHLRIYVILCFAPDVLSSSRSSIYLCDFVLLCFAPAKSALCLPLFGSLCCCLAFLVKLSM
ncbi:hypothetical protein Tco_1076487 [Tanacetum coccineum]